MAQEKPHSAELQDSQNYRSQNYRIHVGDVLQVSVYQHPELSRRIAIDGDGNHILSMEGEKPSKASAIDGMLSEMKVAGLSLPDVAAAVREKLRPTIANSQVTITVIDSMIKPLPVPDKPSPRLWDTPPPAQKQSSSSA